MSAKKKIPTRPYSVRSSGIHGRGVFATKSIKRGTRIIEYRGSRSTIDEERETAVDDPNDPNHTFLFELSDGRSINAGINGNAARWINHSCNPNCEAFEEGTQVFIYAKRRIGTGEELTYDYQLSLPGRISQKTRRDYACRCGTPQCRQTMLAKSD